MTPPRRGPAAPSPRQLYAAWVEDQVEHFKATLAREELMTLAEEAIAALFDTDDEQYPITEFLLRDAVDALIVRRLRLPGYRQWLRACQMDTNPRPDSGTDDGGPPARLVS